MQIMSCTSWRKSLDKTWYLTEIKLWTFHRKWVSIIWSLTVQPTASSDMLMCAARALFPVSIGNSALIQASGRISQAALPFQKYEGWHTPSQPSTCSVCWSSETIVEDMEPFLQYAKCLLNEWTVFWHFFKVMWS